MQEREVVVKGLPAQRRCLIAQQAQAGRVELARDSGCSVAAAFHSQIIGATSALHLSSQSHYDAETNRKDVEGKWRRNQEASSRIPRT